MNRVASQKPRLLRLAPWGALILLTLAISAGFSIIHLPGTFLIAAMIAGVIVALKGATLELAPTFYQSAQAMIGCMIASTLTPAVFSAFIDDWVIFVGVVLGSLVVSAALGYALCRYQVMPGATGIWGITPGAASAMVVMAEAHGADMRLVAVMQYARLFCVALAASVLSRFFAEPIVANATQAPDWAETTLSFLPVVGIAAAGFLAAKIFRTPSGFLLFPLAIGAALSVTEVVTLNFPHAVQAAAFTLIGWKVGLRFTRETLVYCLHTLPKVLLSIFVLMAFCAALSLVVAYALNVDYLTAFLATSPGGADAMISIAAAAKIDLGFVMSLQVARLIMVILLGPPLARWITRRIALKNE